MSKILLLEDAEDSKLLVTQALKSTGAEIKCARTIQEGFALLETENDFDLYILDVRLPDGSGIEMLERLQEKDETRGRPVILLSGEGEVSTKVLAFRLGADDYLLKPINPAELRARVEGKLRKHHQQRPGGAVRRGILKLDPSLLQASVEENGKFHVLELTAKEFKILFFLLQHENKALSRADIVKAAWGEGVHLASRTVDSHICALRRKLGPAASFIESIPSLGYRFVHETRSTAAAGE
jgi:DNA-binding response OmpR family regulator